MFRALSLGSGARDVLPAIIQMASNRHIDLWCVPHSEPAVAMTRGHQVPSLLNPWAAFFRFGILQPQGQMRGFKRIHHHFGKVFSEAL